MPNVLLTGATGYIASHTWLALQEAGHDVVGIDDFSNSSPAVLERLQRLSSRAPVFERVDVCDEASLRQVFDAHDIDAVVHFAALKAVGESRQRPLDYYSTNIGGLLTLCRVMRDRGCRTLVFSSSATVYGEAPEQPVREDSPLSYTNPYGATKLFGESILRDLAAADESWAIASLRYFNPIGAHESGLIGEDPRGEPANLLPYIAQVAVGRRDRLRIFGNDYDTPDGTGVRDYIHVVDLAEGHVAALRLLAEKRRSLTVNLGTGIGYSVLDVVHAYERACGRSVPCEIVARRPGDVARCYADPALARELLGWRARRDLDAMCADSWRWQSSNPRGYSA
jgi:UDP-glucose 4-epimerase